MRIGPIPFRFENMWLKVEGFKGLVNGWWSGYHFFGSFSFILASKLKALKSYLKRWNKDVFDNVSFKKDVAFNEISFWDAKDREGLFTFEEADARRRAFGDYNKWALFKEILWRQKSRELWLRKRDKNTWYLHKMANAHRRRSCLTRIKIDGQWFS